MKKKISLHLAIISCLALILCTCALTGVFYRIFFEQIKHDIRVNAELICTNDALKHTQDASMVQRLYGSLDNNNLRMTWIRADGHVLFDNDVDERSMANHLDRPEIQDALHKGQGESTRHSATSHFDTYYYAVLLDNGTIVRLSMHVQTIADIFFATLPIVGGIVLVVFLICVLVGKHLTNDLLGHLDILAKNYDLPTSAPVYKELEPFIRTMREQHEKILLAAKSRQDFTANVTHELKTPITAISGYAELIENKMVDAEEAVHVAAQIRENSHRLLSLVCDIIRLSELDHPEFKHKFEEVDLLRLARETTQALQPIAEQRGLTLTCSGISVRVQGNYALLREMLENLIQNALTYNKTSGSVCACVVIEHTRPTIVVKDTGIGIPEAEQARIFERFYRVDKSHARQTGGTGLGLAIVKHIADIHSATIHVKSECGVGTEMRFVF